MVKTVELFRVTEIIVWETYTTDKNLAIENVCNKKANYRSTEWKVKKVKEGK